MKYFLFIFCFTQSLLGVAQEFFPTYGPASNLPKGVLRLKLSNEYYTDVTQPRIWQGLTISYGISSKLEITQVYSFSNHHGYILPQDFIYYDNNLKSLRTNGYENGKPYPYSFENLAVTLKYRFLALDGQNEHFRMAALFQLAGGNEPHMVAESSLLGDNSGASGGIIATYLKNRLAISITGGFISPYKYIQADSNIILNYNNAFTYSLSFGYLLLPRKYESYKQTNVNLYMEFVGESYGGMHSISDNGQNVIWTDVTSLNKGYYLEARPAVQFIFQSNTRLDLSMAYLLMGHSYERSYPIYFLSIQHDFFL
ncbi:MAG TPA: hypothetical protein VN922_00780 [Bacteroidia bacterium]|nr:hypothetical protein [Bacteroidia bacterium]